MLSLLEKKPYLVHYDSKFPWTINYPRFPAYEILHFSANVQPDKAATYFYGTEITFSELYKITIRMANTFIKLGVEKGDRIGILLPNCPQFVISYWALLQTGAIVVNLNPMYTYDELKFCAENTGLKGLITFDAILPIVKAVGQAVDIPILIVTRVTDFVNGAPVSTPEALGLEEGWHHFSQL
jgi:long-chain acyl-CoA synthetase